MQMMLTNSAATTPSLYQSTYSRVFSPWQGFTKHINDNQRLSPDTQTTSIKHFHDRYFH
jgi:hypothetical protein